MKIKSYLKEKVWPFLAGMASGAVVLLAFFIPSLQDQYDRYQSRKIIKQYEQLGNDFYKEERYDMAEQAYEKAFELSDSKRLDIEMKRLDAKVNRINMNPKWGTAPPEELEEIDFQYLLHFLKGKDKDKERVSILNSYGIFLVAENKNEEAEKTFKDAIQLDTTDAMGYVNLGNLYDQEKKKDLAIFNYLKAISLEKENARAHYNLGLLYYEQGKMEEAKKQFSDAIKADSTDTDARAQYKQLITQPDKIKK